MPLRKPSPITAARLNDLQDRVIDVVGGVRTAIPHLVVPLRIQSGGAPAAAAGWSYVAAGGYAESVSGGGDDLGYVGIDVHEGDQLVGWRVLIYQAGLAAGYQIKLVRFPDGATVADVANSDLTPTLVAGVWRWVEHTITPAYTVGNESIAMALSVPSSFVSQRFGGGYILVQRP